MIKIYGNIIFNDDLATIQEEIECSKNIKNIINHVFESNYSDMQLDIEYPELALKPDNYDFALTFYFMNFGGDSSRHEFASMVNLEMTHLSYQGVNSIESHLHNSKPYSSQSILESLSDILRIVNIRPFIEIHHKSETI